MITKIEKFETKTFLDSTAAVFEHGDKYVIKSGNGSEYSAGMFFGFMDVVSMQGKHFSAKVDVVATGKKTMPMAMVLFYNEEGKKIEADYFFKGEKTFTVETEVPKEAVKAEIDLMSFGYGDYAVEFTEPEIEITDKKPHRIAHIATAYIEIENSTEANMKHVLEVIDMAGSAEDKPDIICFTEGVHDLRTGKWYFLTEESDEIKAVLESAKKNSIYVLFTCHEEDEKGYRYNSAFFISPDGEILGKYRKSHLTLSELKGGLVPGDEIPVFDLPFGKFGILICWDQWFYEASRMIASKGAEMLFWLTRGYHEERLITRARDNGMYYISSNPSPEKCCICHPTTGEIIARGSGVQGYASAKIDLDERPVSEYKSFGVNGGNDRDIFINELRPDLYNY